MAEVFTWSAVERAIEEEIAKATASLQTPYLPLDQTENLRGQIEGLRSLANRFAPAPSIEGAPLSYDVIRPATDS